jgi:hypothetical protein
MIEIERKTFDVENKKRGTILAEINEFIKALYMDDEDISLIEEKLNNIGVDRIVFRDENNKLSPIKYGDINIVGVFVSYPGVIWLVDDTKISHDISGEIRNNYYQDKHSLLSFLKSFRKDLICKIDAYKAPVKVVKQIKNATVK